MSRALIIGNGGREHAIAEQIAPAVDELFFTSTNAGMEAIPNARSIGSINPAEFAVEQAVDLTIFGPEKPLADGLSNQIRAEGLTVFGPSQEAAQLEASKYYARQFMSVLGIPSPRWMYASNWAAYERNRQYFGEATDIVIKADGLAGGKGVELPDTWEEADESVKAMLSGAILDGAGEAGVLIEQRCHGPEVSMFVLSDGKNIQILPFTQDHKRRDDGDTGKNTGGMGAYTIPDGALLTARQISKLQEIAEKSIAGMAQKGIPYKGVLYVGTMMAEEYDDDPVVIEYNVRFGDPEAQVLMTLMGEDTFDILASTDRLLRTDLLTPAKLAGNLAVCVCMAAGSYPEGKSIGEAIYGLEDEYEGVSVFHGGTKRSESGIVQTNGGRILYPTGWGKTLHEARDNVYKAIDPSGIEGGLYFLDEHHRTDIAWQLLGR